MPKKDYESQLTVVKNSVDSKRKNLFKKENPIQKNPSRKNFLAAIGQAGDALVDIVAQAVPDRLTISDRKLVFRDKGKIIIINKDEVTHCRGMGDCTEYHFKSRSPLVKCGSIGQTISDLIDPIFVITHKSWIVNLNEICSFTLGTRELELNDGTIIPVAKSRQVFFKELWN